MRRLQLCPDWLSEVRSARTGRVCSCVPYGIATDEENRPIADANQFIGKRAQNELQILSEQRRLLSHNSAMDPFEFL